MKLLTKEEEQAHYNEVLKGGAIGGVVGLSLGVSGVLLASRRYPAFRGLTLPFRAFLITSTATFGAIVNADRWSMAFSKSRDPMRSYRDSTAVSVQEAIRKEGAYRRFMAWGREHRYSIVFGSWVVGMGAAIAIVGRDRYMTTAQKLVQARVYAQALTVAVLVLTAAFEMNDAKKGSGRWETVMVLDPSDPTHKHLIEKKIHKEEYEGQDLWKGELSICSGRSAPGSSFANCRPRHGCC
jgi:hypothetical protein